MHAIAESCPSCGGFTVRPSRWRPDDWLAVFHLLRPLRCRSCGDRFYASLFAPVAQDPSARKKKRALVLRVRVKRPSVVLRALLWFVSEPPKDA